MTHEIEQRHSLWRSRGDMVSLKCQLEPKSVNVTGPLHDRQLSDQETREPNDGHRHA